MMGKEIAFVFEDFALPCIWCLPLLEVVSKPQITPKIKAWADEKAQHTRAYVSILRRAATQIFGVRWGFETTYREFVQDLFLP